MPLPPSRPLRPRYFAAGCLFGTLGCGAQSTTLSDVAPAGQFGHAAGPDSGLADGESAANADGSIAETGGPTVMVRVVHAIPNVGAVVLCRFEALAVDDPSTPEDELERDNHSGELVAEAGPLAEGLAFGDVSPWVKLRVADTGVLSLHRVPPSETADAGVADGGSPEAGAADAGYAPDAAEDAAIAVLAPCDPATLEVALPLPLPSDWLLPLAAPPTTSPTPATDAGGADAGIAYDDAGLDAAAPSLADQLGQRGIASALTGASQVTLFASGLALSPSALTTALSKLGTASVHAADLAFGPRLLASEKPAAPSATSFSLSLAHLVPDVLANGVSPASLRACITIDGVEGRALPAVSASPVAFRERVLLSADLAPAARYRIRVFAADDFAVPGQDCANTTRAPLALLDAEPKTFGPGVPYTLAVTGLAAPESLCSAYSSTGLSRPGCFGASDHTVRAFLLED